MEGPIWRSPLPAAEHQPDLVDREILRSARSHAGRPAIVDALTGRSLTYGQLADGSLRLAGGLAARGITRGDRVAIVAANAIDYPVALIGSLAAGAVVASANPGLTAAELARQVARTRPRVVFADAHAWASVEEALAVAGTGSELVSIDGSRPGPSLAGLLAEPAEPPPGRDPADPALLFPSSGTTGLPKIAVHTHGSTTAFLQAFARTPSVRFTPDDVVSVVAPYTHLYGTAVLCHALRAGATVVGSSNPAFDLAAFLLMLQDHAVTVTTVVPPVLLALAGHPLVAEFDLSSLRLLFTSAAPSAPELQERVAARLGCRVVDALGSTEAWCFAPAPDVPVRGSVGMIGAAMEAAIVDPASGARLGAGRPGELWIRGPQVLRSYLDDEEATAAAFGGEGWLRTGDLCTVDDGGNLFIIDRLKELLKVGGYSVAPAEVERELAAHPAVADAVVVGRPDHELGQVPVAYVTLRSPVEAAELIAWVGQRLAPWKHPRDVVVIDRVPRSPAGKILRRELTERERAAQSVS